MTHDAFARRMELYARHVNAPYVEFLKRLGMAADFVRAEKALVYDRDGRAFIDCIAGYGNLNIGHAHPRVISAVVDELRSTRPFNWPFLSEVHARLAEKLAGVAPGNLECVFIVNSGSEAVDSAIKLVRLATGRPGLVAARGAWHGFTFGALSASEQTLCRGFQPLLEGVTHVPYGEVAAFEHAIDDRTGAVIVEPVQAESGAVVPPDGFLRELADLCQRRNIVFILDEIKTGIGKTGKMFACEHEGVVPDLLLAGKSLGGGAMPIGAIVSRRKWWGKFGFSFPMSSSSGAGNAPACAAALATLEVVEEEKLCPQAARQGERLLRALAELAADFPKVAIGASGRGLLLAFHAANTKVATEVVAECAQRGVLMANAFCDRSRILIEPPLCITDEEVSQVLAVLHEAVAQVASQG